MSEVQLKAIEDAIDRLWWHDTPQPITPDEEKQCFDTVRKALEQLRELGWNDIALAPKDGTYVLLYCGMVGVQPHIIVANYFGDGMWATKNLAKYGQDTVTHYMPLPPHPTQKD